VIYELERLCAQETSDNMNRKAFTLIELMIVVSILGILAAIVLPILGNSSQQAKEAAAGDVLRIMRSQIELYRFQHQGLVPGYMNGLQATTTVLTNQFIGTTTITGMASSSRVPSGQYLYGPYAQKLPVNPLNNLSTIKYVASATAFSTAADKTTGWLYKKETAEFKLNWTGTDSQGKNYIDY
jgi:general secretion pathway protein G